MSLAEERKARRANIRSKIDDAAKKRQQAKKFAADIKAAYAKDTEIKKKKSVTDRITKLGNNPNAKIKGTTLVSYMANNSPAQALRDLGILTPKIEKALTRKGPAPKKSEKKNIPFRDKPSPSMKKPETKKINYNVGESKGGVSFRKAFAYFRKSGAKTFTWNGKKYTTELAKKGKK